MGTIQEVEAENLEKLVIFVGAINAIHAKMLWEMA